MKKAEKIFAILGLIGIIGKFFMMPASGVLITIGLSFLAMLYYPLGFASFNNIGFRKLFKKSSYQGLGYKKIIGAIGAGMAIATLCVGIIFKFQHFPGAAANLITGIVLSIIVGLVCFFKYQKHKDNLYKNILIRIAILIPLPLIIFLGPKNLIDQVVYRNHPAYIEASEALRNDHNNIILQKKVELEWDRAHRPKKEFEMLHPEEKTN